MKFILIHRSKNIIPNIHIIKHTNTKINNIIIIISDIDIARTAGIQIGESIHIHAQSIYPVNFKPINKIVSNPRNPIPSLSLIIITNPTFVVHHQVQH